MSSCPFALKRKEGIRLELKRVDLATRVRTILNFGTFCPVRRSKIAPIESESWAEPPEISYSKEVTALMTSYSLQLSQNTPFEHTIGVSLTQRPIFEGIG